MEPQRIEIVEAMEVERRNKKISGGRGEGLLMMGL